MDTASFSENAEILVVDDSQTIRNHIKRILENTYTVHTVASGEECLEFVKTTIPSLILLDIHMTGIDGLKTLHGLKANPETNSIPVIILTGDEHN